MAETAVAPERVAPAAPEKPAKPPTLRERFAATFAAPPAEAVTEEVSEVEAARVAAEGTEAVTDETAGIAVEGAETVEADPAGPAFTVLQDGKEIPVSHDEARNGYLRHIDYTKKTEAVAAERRAVEAERIQVREQREQYTRVLPQLDAALKGLRVPEPTAALAQSNPQEYVRQKAAYDEWNAQLGAVRAEQDRVMRERQAEQQGQQHATLKREAELLATKLPKWLDQKYVAEVWPGMIEVGEAIGYTRDELNNIGDHRAYLVLHELAVSRRLKAKGQKAVTEAKKTAAPSSAEAGNPESRAFKQQRERFKKTGKPQDGAPLFAALLARKP